MEALKTSSFPSFHFAKIPKRVPRTQLEKPISDFVFNHRPSSFLSSILKEKIEFRVLTATSSTVSTEFTGPPEQELEIHGEEEKFDWYAHWYPIMPLCDLDKSVPHAKKVMGLDVVIWWDRNESAWKVFDDRCPHRLAPLSQGRIDQWGRLQCVYHGWCFSGSGNCKFIPQAPTDGPP
ncbi:Protochlorophyllide-dependent translocon component 52, chloroplastic [Sarracenia purpurea var. burkii]